MSLTLQFLIDSSAGILNLANGELHADASQASIAGVEVYQCGVDASAYSGRIVMILSAPNLPEPWERIVDECRQAVALIVPRELPATFFHSFTIPVYQPASWVTAGEVLSALFEFTRTGVSAGFSVANPDADALERDATFASQRRESALLSLVNGTPDASVPAALVGLRPDRDHVAIAAAPSAEHLETYLLAVAAEFPAERSVVSDGTVYTVVSLDPNQDLTHIISRLRSRLGRAIHSELDLPVGVGSVAHGVFTIHESVAVAREILRALRIRLGTPWQLASGGARVAGTRDVPDALALIHAADALRPLGSSLAEPLMMLAAHDRDHNSELLPSVLAALEYRTNATLAARQLGVHANSLRARLERAKDISGVDVNDPVSALRAMVAFLAFPEVHNLARPTH